MCTTSNDTVVKITSINRSIKGLQGSKCNVDSSKSWNPRMFPTHCLLFQYMCKGPLILGVPTSVHNVNISSHPDAFIVSNMYVSLALNSTYIHVWASLYLGTLLNLKYRLDPFT